MNYRWVDGPLASDEEWDQIEGMLAARGHMSLNRFTTRVLIAEDGEGIAGFFVFQMVPFTGPLFVRPSARGTGIAEELADRMLSFLAETNARGWITIAESPHSVKLCRERNMTEVKAPVFVMGEGG